MPGDPDPSVEGPEFIEKVARADEIIGRLQSGGWDFEKAREVFARDARADVLGKEILNFYDGRQISRYGKLILGGVGRSFNLIGHFPSTATFRVNGHGVTDLVKEVKAALGSDGLTEVPRYRELGRPQKIEFFNYSIFYTLEELIRFFILNNSGCFPSTLEHLKRLFAAGNIIQGSQYAPAIPSFDLGRPAMMEVECLEMSFPSRTMEWMERPLYGGLDQVTVHKEYLLTPERTELAHPFLELERTGKVNVNGRTWYAREFGGLVHKEGIRDSSGPEEGASVPEERKG
jgi:hypothetical protein